MADIRFEGRAGRLGAVMTAVVVDGPKGKGKEYRLPTDHERSVAEVTEEQLQALYADIPFGLPEEPLASEDALGFRVPLYGFDNWRKLFTNRQLLALGGFVLILRRLMQELDGRPESWREALIANLALVNDRLADYCSAICSWHNGREVIRNTFGRFALPIVWDYTELNPLSDSSGNFLGALDWVSKVCEHLQKSIDSAQSGESICASAITCPTDSVDLILTDPPYYDAIPYSDLMDFFYVWLRRSISGLSGEIETVFSDALGPKWDHDSDDGELIDDASRFGGDRERSKQNYEDGMARSFLSCHTALQPDGRLVVVFANKHPDAWETLVAALIRAGFVVDGSWPIQTEMGTRTRAMASAALSSSVWIVCKKRPAARPGWDTTVLNEMRDNITQQLRDFWDAGIRGPDFVWAATGPALEAFSKHPVVKKANDPNQLMSVSEFLREVRRMVVDFVVGRVLTQDGDQDLPRATTRGAATGLDDVTTYYLLHRHDFGMEEAPVGGCILYALSCNLSDSALVNQHDLLAQAGKGGASDEPEEDDPPEDAAETSGGAKVKLKPYNRRQGRNLGLEAPGGRPRPPHRPSPQAHAPLARRRPSQSGRLPRHPRPPAQRPVQPNPPSPHRTSRRRLRRTLHPRSPKQPPSRPRRCSGAEAEAASIRRMSVRTLPDPASQGQGENRHDTRVYEYLKTGYCPWNSSGIKTKPKLICRSTRSHLTKRKLFSLIHSILISTILTILTMRIDISSLASHNNIVY